MFAMNLIVELELVHCLEKPEDVNLVGCNPASMMYIDNKTWPILLCSVNLVVISAINLFAIRLIVEWNSFTVSIKL